MTYLTICEYCRDDRHDECTVSVNPLTPEQRAAGFLGGRHCVCSHSDNKSALEQEIWDHLDG